MPALAYLPRRAGTARHMLTQPSGGKDDTCRMRMYSLVLVVGLFACTKPNPNRCCNDEADCMAAGLAVGSTCSDGLLCRGNQCIAVSCSTSAECECERAVLHRLLLHGELRFRHGLPWLRRNSKHAVLRFRSMRAMPRGSRSRLQRRYADL